jgi:hypothetical protein
MNRLNEILDLLVRVVELSVLGLMLVFIYKLYLMIFGVLPGAV